MSLHYEYQIRKKYYYLLYDSFEIRLLHRRLSLPFVRWCLGRPSIRLFRFHRRLHRQLRQQFPIQTRPDLEWQTLGEFSLHSRYTKICKSWSKFLMQINNKFLINKYFRSSMMLCSIICFTSWAPRRCPGLFHNFIVKKNRADWSKDPAGFGLGWAPHK